MFVLLRLMIYLTCAVDAGNQSVRWIGRMPGVTVKECAPIKIPAS